VMGTDIARLHQPHQPASDKTNLFQKGHQKLGGRRAGTRNRFGGDLRMAIVAAIHETGYMKRAKGRGLIATGKDGVKGFVMWLAVHEPKTAAALFARVLPYFIEVEEAPPIMSRSELEAELTDLGLPLGLIEYFQKVPAPLDLDEDPDPYGVYAERAAKADAAE
jgi:hypothetical protein